MTPFRSVVLAFVAFVTIAPAAVLFWTVAMIAWVASVQPRLPDAWHQPVGVALLALSVLSSLVLYFVVLARELASAPGMTPTSLALHLFTAGLAPVALAVGLLWFAILRMRIGW